MRRAVYLVVVLLSGVSLSAQESASPQPEVEDKTTQAIEAQAAANRSPTDDAVKSNSDRPLKFRRVFVPEQELLSRVHSTERYVPMEISEFDAAVRRLQEPSRLTVEPSAQIEDATYKATLDSATRLHGKGTWVVKRMGKEPVLLRLTGLRFAMANPRWIGSGDSAGAQAYLGAADDGETALYVDRNGKLEFEWVLAAVPDREHPLSYELAFPHSPAQRLEFTLPADLVPSVDEAILSGSHIVKESNRKWTIDLVGRSNAHLRLRKEDDAGELEPLVLLRSSTTYELSLQGLQVLAEWRLDVSGKPLRELEIELDAGLTLLSATSGDMPLTWSEIANDDRNGAKHLRLEFSEPLQGNRRIVRLNAVSALTTDAGWTMPRIDAPDAVWQDGTMALVVAGPLALNQLDLTNCRQTKRETLPTPVAGEAIGVQTFSRSAAVRVHVAPRESQLELKSAATIELADDKATGKYVADFTAREGECFELSADVSPDWIIDSVQGSPAGMVAGWDRQRDGATGRLLIHLAKAISRHRPLNLTVNAARRRTPLGEALTINDLRLLDFHNTSPVRRLELVKTASPYRLDVHRAENLLRLDPAKLDTADRRLLGEVRQGLLFVVDDATNDLQMTLLPERPRFAAAVESRAVVGDSELEERYKFQISPESNELERVVVHFSQARSAPFTWTIDQGTNEPITARRLSHDEQASLGVGAAGETWEVRIKPAISVPFALSCKRESRLEAKVPLSLPSIVDATSQRGEVVIELASEYLPTIEEHRVKPLAVDPPQAGNYQNTLAAYEYDPTEDLLVAKEAALLLSIDRSDAHRRRAWAWRSTLDAWFSPSRHIDYRTRFWFENTGRSQVAISLPGATILRVRIDGRSTEAAGFDAKTGRLDLPLPAGRRFCVAEIIWQGEGGSLGSVSSRAIQWPEADVPVLARDTVVWLPAGYFPACGSGIGLPAATRSVSWRERLFGPLGRPSQRETFEPWLMRDWLELTQSRTNSIGMHWAERFISQSIFSDRSAGQEVDKRQDNESACGEQLYSAWYRAAPSDSVSPRPLLIDTEAVEDANIAPWTTVVQASIGNRAPGSVRELLEQHGLMLLVLPREVLLTSRRSAAEWCDRNIATSRELVVDIAAASDEDLRLFNGPGAHHRIVPLDAWVSLDEERAKCWNGSDLEIANAERGWTPYPMEWTAGQTPANIWIVRRQTLLALSFAIGLTFAGIAWIVGGRRPIAQLVIAGVFAMTALALPAPLSVLGTASFLGILAGHVGGWLHRRMPAKGPSLELVPTSATAITTSLLLLLLWSVAADADEPVGDGRPAQTAIRDVFIPLQEDGAVSGSKVYVPEELYKALGHTQRIVGKQPSYLITSADYEAMFKPAIDAQAAATHENWTATLTVQVFAAPAQVVVPLGARGAEIIPDSGKLNGHPLRFGWDATRQSIAFDIDEPGASTVELQFRPGIQKGAASRSIDFSIPRLPQSRVRWSRTGAIDAVHIEAVGGSVVDEATKQFVASIGPHAQIRAVCNDATTRSEPAAQFDTEEISWLRIHPGAAILNTRLGVHVRRGEVHELRLALDDRLLPLPLADSSPIASVRRTGKNELELQLAHPITDSAALELAFVVQGANGIANIPWPKLEVTAAQSRRCIVAYSVDLGLDATAAAPDAAKSLNSAEFAALWGEGEARPASAYAVESPTFVWQVDVRPRQTKTTCRSRTTAVVRASVVDVEWDATLEIAGGSRFQIRAPLPDDLFIDRIEARDAAGLRPSHWAVSNERMLTLFLEAAASGRLDISLHGHIPARQAGKVAIPLIKPEGSVDNDDYIVIARHPSAMATVDPRGDLVPLAPADNRQLLGDEAGATLGIASTIARPRVLAAYHLGGTRDPIVVSVQRNQPNVAAVQALSLNRSNDSWQAALDLDLKIANGVLDAVRINAPAAWQRPFRVEPEMPFDVIDVAGENQRELVLFPPQPIAAEARFHIVGRLATPPGQRIRVPDARYLGADVRQYFALPLQQELQTLAWQTRGLQPDTIPKGLSRPSADDLKLQTFSRVADQFRAELRSVEKIADDCRVRLADVAVSWTSDLSLFGAASFDVEPAGRDSCLLALPANFRLIHLSVDGRPLRLVSVADDRWQVPLGGRLPLHIEVVFAGRSPSFIAVPQDIEGPRLIGLTVERSLWSVSGPSWASLPESSSFAIVGQPQVEAARYRSITALIESAANTLAEVGSNEAPRWYAPWVGRIAACRSALERLRALAPEPESDWESVPARARIDEEQARLAERLGTDEILAQASAAPLLSAVSVWQESLQGSRANLQAIISGEAASLRPHYVWQNAGDFSGRVIYVLVAAAMLLLAAAVMRYTEIIEWFAARPRTIGMVAGIFWWLFLWPSALGWLVMLISVIFPYLWPRQWRREPLPRSA